MSVRNSPVRRIVAAIVATVAILFSLAAATAGESRVVIEIREFEFVPERPTVSPGDVVVWKNLDIVPHTATSEDDSWDSSLIEAGGTWEMVVTEDMVMAYYCRFHPSMIATLNLEAMRNVLLAAPPIAILGRIAWTFWRLAPDHRGIPAFLTLIPTIGVIAGTAIAVLA